MSFKEDEALVREAMKVFYHSCLFFSDEPQVINGARLSYSDFERNLQSLCNVVFLCPSDNRSAFSEMLK